MAKTAITINGDTRILKRTSTISTFLIDPRKLLSDIGDYLKDEFDKNFPTEGARLEKKWKPLTVGTIREKARAGYGGKGILERTGKMRKGFEKTTTRREVRVFNDVDYFKYHQLGTSKMAKRVMITAPKKVKREIVAKIRKEIDL